MPHSDHKHATYPNEFFDQIAKRIGAANDCQLGQMIHIDSSTIRKIRNGVINVSGQNVLNIYDATGWSIEEIRSLLYQRTVTKHVWKQIQSSRPTLQVQIKPPEETSDVIRAEQKLDQLKCGQAQTPERRQSNRRSTSIFDVVFTEPN